MRNIVFINESSGNVQALGVSRCARVIRESLEDRDVRIELLGGDIAPIKRIINETIESGKAARLFSLGGDGTLAAIATALAGTDFSLAPLPGGTMNALSRDLGFHPDLLEALGQIAGLESRSIDVATVGDHVFLNNVVFGAYAEAAESREHIRKGEGIIEKVGALGEVFAAVTNAEAKRYRLEIDGVVVDIETNTLMISNNIYTSARGGAPARARLDEGVLGVYVTHSTTSGDFIDLMLEALNNGLTESAKIELYRVQSCEVQCLDGPLEASIDGETKRFDTRVTFKLAPSNLRVLAPPRS
jgi:diacylglycerol kinase family enzyme